MTTPELTEAPPAMTSAELTRRAWIAVGVAEVVFALFTVVGAAFAFRMADATDSEGTGLLDFAKTIGVASAVCVLIGVPVGVHTAGRLTESVTRLWRTWISGIAHLFVGVVLGAVLAVVVAMLGVTTVPAAALTFALPIAMAGWLSNIVVRYAARYEWMVRIIWSLAAVPLLAAVVWLGLTVVGRT